MRVAKRSDRVQIGANRHVGEAQHDVNLHRMEFTPNDMALIDQIIMLREGIWLGPAVLHHKRIKFLKVFVRPTYFCSKIIEPIYQGKPIVDHNTTVSSAS